MQNSFSRKFLCATIAGAFLTACAGSGTSGVPNAASSVKSAQNGFGQEAGSIIFSGVYEGKFRHNPHRPSKVFLSLSQSQNSLGGALISKEGSEGLAMAIAWVANGNKISGNGIQPTGSGASSYCTYSMSGTYKHRRISGSYSPVYGCSGQTGTFTLWHKCYFQGTGSEAIRPESRVKPC